MEDQEKQRKRKREHEDPEVKAETSKAGAETPSLKEEVEEFFEILQRMHMAVRYFDNKVNGDGDGKRFSRRLWDALETGRMELANAVTATTLEVDCSDLRAETVAGEPVTENNRVFDLNIEPDQDITQ